MGKSRVVESFWTRWRPVQDLLRRSSITIYCLNVFSLDATAALSAFDPFFSGAHSDVEFKVAEVESRLSIIVEVVQKKCLE